MSERPDRRWVDGEAPDLEAGTAAETDAAKAKAKRKRKREREDADDKPEPKDAADRPERDDRDTPEDVPEGTGSVPESELRKIAAEAAFRRRVELAELRESVGEEAYAELRERYGSDMRWYLEEGPLLLRAVVAETEPEDGPVEKVAIQYAVTRETEPVPPAKVVERITAAFSEPVPAGAAAERSVSDTPGQTPEATPEVTSETASRKAEALAREMPAEESVELVVDTSDRGPVFVSIDRGTVEVHETASEDSPVVMERAVGPEPSAASGSADPLAEAERVASETAAEPLPERQMPEQGFARALEAVERAWAAERLPPIAGGSPELDEPAPAGPDRPPSESPDAPKDSKETPSETPEERERKPSERPPEPEPPAAPSAPGAELREPKRPRRRSPHVRTRVPEYRGRPAEGMPPLPDADTRRRAKRMLRKLAARFGLRLTPDLEGYLMQIVFRVRFVDGRFRRGLGVNIDVLIRIMEALRSHYPLYSPKRRY